MAARYRAFSSGEMSCDGLGVPADERKRRFQVVACRRHKLLAFVLEVAFAVPAGVQSRRHVAQCTVEFTDFISAFQVGFEFIECKNGYQPSLFCCILQWVSDHAAHDFIENKQENQV